MVKEDMDVHVSYQHLWIIHIYFLLSIGTFSGYSKYYTKITNVNPNNSYYSVDIWVSRYDINNTLTSENINFDKSIINIKNGLYH